MANPSSFPHIPNLGNGPVQNIEVPPQTNSDDGILLQNGLQPNVNRVESYHGLNYDYGYWAQYYDGASYQGPPPPPALNSDGQYAYHRNPNIDYPPPGNDQDNLVASDPSHMEYHSSLAYDIPNGVRDRTPLMSDLANSFSQSVPGSPPPGTLAMEGLKRLADRYLHDPGSRIDTLRMGLSPSGGRLRVTITFDIDV